MGLCIWRAERRAVGRGDGSGVEEFQLAVRAWSRWLLGCFQSSSAAGSWVAGVAALGRWSGPVAQR